jgi:outer membrane protein assembly factor BamB
VQTKPIWLTLPMEDHHFKNAVSDYTRPSYAVNDSFPQVKEEWHYQDNSDIGSGTAFHDDLVFTTNTNGEIIAIKRKNGKVKWRYRTAGKIYSIPAVKDGLVIAGSSDEYIYAIKASNGKLAWKYKAEKAVLGHPVIYQEAVYIGSSDGHFRKLDLHNGNLIWDFADVKGFVVTRPLIYNNRVMFGCWNNDFYCLDVVTGNLLWKWNNGSSNRMFSPAACFPVATHNRVFIVAPDRYMTAIDIPTGNVIWRKQIPEVKVRESMGLSRDSSMVFVKTMQGNVEGISTTANDMTSVWKADVSLGYEICPTAIVQKNHTVFVPTQSGVTVAIDSENGKVLWKHKTSNCLITNLLPIGNKEILVTTMDGKVSLLKF